MHLGGNEWGVDGVAGRLSLEHRQHLFSRLDGDLALRLPGGGAEMGCEDHLGVGQQRAWVRRLFGEHVQGHTAQAARLQARQQGRLVNEFAACHVDDAGAVLDVLDLPSAQHAAGSLCERGMQGDKVGLRQQIVQRQQLDSDAAGVVRCDVGVVADQPHAKGLSPARDLGADPAQAADAQGLFPHLDAHEGAAAPLAGFQGPVSTGNIARHCQHQRQRVFGGGDGVCPWAR